LFATGKRAFNALVAYNTYSGYLRRQGPLKRARRGYRTSRKRIIRKRRAEEEGRHKWSLTQNKNKNKNLLRFRSCRFLVDDPVVLVGIWRSGFEPLGPPAAVAQAQAFVHDLESNIEMGVNVTEMKMSAFASVCPWYVHT
jgi:hypothetical protein